LFARGPIREKEIKVSKNLKFLDFQFRILLYFGYITYHYFES
jgi:hypothetical protein